MTTLHRTINGVPYTFVANVEGWGVCAADSPTSRFYRSYQVRCDKQGRPYACTCPHAHHGRDEADGNIFCKHMREAEAIYREQHPEEALKEEAARCGF